MGQSDTCAELEPKSEFECSRRPECKSRAVMSRCKESRYRPFNVALCQLGSSEHALAGALMNQSDAKFVAPPSEPGRNRLDELVASRDARWRQ